MTTVRAPGSSANLGPGFDVLGIAISRHAWAADHPPPHDPAAPPCEPDHIARIAHRMAGGTGEVWCWFNLRPGRGMGFSGAARSAGAMLACRQLGLGTTEGRAISFRAVCDLERHGDNAAPSVFGGIQIATEQDGSEHRWQHHRIDAELPGTLLLWVPDAESPTDRSRAALPRRIPMADAVFNIGRTALLLAALYERRVELFATATDDRLHQLRRMAALPGSEAARSRAMDAGALACWLSGSGPSLAVLTDPDRVVDISAALVARPTDAPGHVGEVLALSVDRLGAVEVDDSRPTRPVE